jgi:hypothetical protein
MRRILPLAIGVIALIVVTVIAISNSRPTNNPNPVKVTETVQPTSVVQVQATATPATAKVDVGNVGSPRVLTWNQDTSQLAWIGKDGKVAPIGQPSANKAAFLTCGTSPNGELLIVFQGADRLGDAQPYILPLNGGDRVGLGTNVGLACALPGRIQVSPDGNRIGIMKFDGGTAGNTYAEGLLQVAKLPSGESIGTIENVTAYDLQNDGAIAVQFIDNTKNQAKHVDVIFWDGSKTRKIEENLGLLNTDEKADCEFVAAKVLRVSERIYILFGEKCKQGGNTWRIHRIDFSGANPQEVLSGPTGASGAAKYFTNTAANEMYLMPNNNEILFTVPNGIASDLVNIARLSIADGTKKDVLASVVVDQYPSDTQRQFLRSPDGKQYAFVTRNGDKTEQLYIYDLTQPDNTPTAITTNGRLDRITGIAWQKDGQRLYYSIIGDTQAIYSVTLKGESNLLARGTFTGLAASEDGTLLATSEKLTLGTNDFRENLILLDTRDESKGTLVEGAKGDRPLLPVLLR